MVVCDLCKRRGRSFNVDTVTVRVRGEEDDWSEPHLEIQLCQDCQEVFADKLTEFMRLIGGGPWDSDLEEGPEPEAPAKPT